jgi:head-tail adaptor
VLLNDTCTIQRKTVTQSATSGGNQHAWASSSTGVACSVQADSGTEGNDFRRETGKRAYRVYFEYGTDVRHEDRIVWGGLTLSVTGPPVDGAGRQVYARVNAEEVISGGQR